MVALEDSAHGLGEEGSAGEVKAKHAKRERELNCISRAEGQVAFIGKDDNGSHAQVLTGDGRLVSRRILEIVMRIELGPTTLSNLAHLKRNGSKRG
jgi:hypothetical protein